MLEAERSGEMRPETNNLDDLLKKLRQAGQNPEPALLDRVKALGTAAVRPLIEMAVDDELHRTESESPEVWAPVHAIKILGELGAAEAVEPLLPLFQRDEDDWLGQVLAETLGRIGEPALAPLRTLLFDRRKTIYTRARAGNGLAKLGQHHPERRAEVVAILTARLDPAESQKPEDETLNAFVIGDLLDLKAVEAVPAIRQAYEEDRVDRRVVGFKSVVEELGLPPDPLAAIEDEEEDEESEMRLWLRCTACGYERRHQVGKVYYDLATADRRKQGKKTPYNEFVITRRITCPKCGALDQYELTADAHLAFTAELLKLVVRADETGSRPESDGPLVFLRFTLSDGREMHPLAARDLYRQQVEKEPERADLRVRYANVLRFLGYQPEATSQYQAALQLEPTNVEAYLNLGMFASKAGNAAEARQMYERVVELAPASRLPREKREEFVRFAREELAGAPGSRTVAPTRGVVAASPARPVAVHQPVRAAPKTGRNEPCPCGSGKKYKKCCGR